MGANLLAVSSLWIWVPIVLGIFAVRPARQAVLFSFIFAWLFLPGISFNIPGIPDWTKVTATVVVTTLGALIFDSARMFSFRPRWYDIPMLAWCVTPFASSVAVGQGAYDGLSAVLLHVFSWGMPYLLGRVYFADAEGARRLALGIAAGGIAYIPLCLLEMRLSPVLLGWVYGMGRWEGTRYGGYRPAVFLANGLELGMWMTLATLTAQRLWASGAVHRLRGYPFGALALALAVTTVLCRSTGALCLLALGLAVLWTTRLCKRSWPVWLLLAIPPAYCASRTTGIWSGDDAVRIAKATAGDDRAQSLEFRFQCENNHIVECLKRPAFGYSRTSGYMKGGKGTWTQNIVDGYWMIAFGTMGLVGLASLNAMLLLPMALTARRFPARTWAEPEVAPVVALGLCLALFMIDCLSNAMPNPLYAVAMGGVAGMKAIRGGPRREAEDALGLASALADEGRHDEAEPGFRLAIDLSTMGLRPGDPDTRPILAEALGGLGRSLARSGRDGEAEAALREALAVRLDLASDGHDADRLVDLADGHEELARLLSDSGQVGRAIAERRKALDLRAALLAARPRDPEHRARRVDALNDLAWLLAADAVGPHRDPEAAVVLAAEAARLAPENSACWNTLGVARYRSGDWAGAVDALMRSVALGSPGGSAFDHYFLAMACRKLGEVGHARDWFDRAVAWSDRHRPGHPGLASFRSEAAALLVARSIADRSS